MRRPLTWLAPALAALLSCAPAEPGPRPAQAAQPITHGSADHGDPAVVELLYARFDHGTIDWWNAYGSCTGELIGPSTVLTAGHCAENSDINPNNYPLASDPVNGSGYFILAIFTDTEAGVLDPNSGALVSGKFAVVDAFQHHPGYDANHGDLSTPANDIGIMHLAGSTLFDGTARPAPLDINRRDLAGVALTTTRIVGYGVRAYVTYPDGGVEHDQFGQRVVAPGQEPGFKFQANSTNVQVLNPGELLDQANNTSDPSLVCSGDSGGPTFATLADPGGSGSREFIVAVTSRGDEGCVYFGINTRPDAYLPFISTFMGGTNNPSFGGGLSSFPSDLPSCGADGRCGFGCTTPDPDCPCLADGLCTTACPNVAADPDCPAQCAQDGVCRPTGCPAPDPDCRGDGQTCNANSLCVSGRCALVPGTASRICAEPCDQGQACPSGTSCQLDGQNHHSCLPCGFACGTASASSTASAGSTSGSTSAGSTAGSTGGGSTAGSTGAASTGAGSTTGEPTNGAAGTTGGAATTTSGGATTGAAAGSTGSTGTPPAKGCGCASTGAAELFGLAGLLPLLARRRRR